MGVQPDGGFVPGELGMGLVEGVCVCVCVISNGPGGTSGTHTTCCEERSVLLLVPSPAPGALLGRLTVPA